MATIILRAAENSTQAAAHPSLGAACSIQQSITIYILALYSFLPHVSQHTLMIILPSSACSNSSSSSWAGPPAAAAPRAAAACFTILRLVPASSRSRGFPPISRGRPCPPLAMLLADLPASATHVVDSRQLSNSMQGFCGLHWGTNCKVACCIAATVRVIELSKGLLQQQNYVAPAICVTAVILPADIPQHDSLH